MAQKTWFLPPDFTFTPDGEISLGTIIKHPKRPTACLARLLSANLEAATSSPDLLLPEVETKVESGHLHSRTSRSELSTNSGAHIGELAAFSAKANSTRSKGHSFSAVDHEIRSFRYGIPPETLKAITEMENVSRYISSGVLGNLVKKPVYIISGLRIAMQPLKVTDEKHHGLSFKLQGSAPATVPIPIQAGGGTSANHKSNKVDSYETEAGIVFAYRLHVMRQSRSTGTLDGELFSHRTAFLSGEGEANMEEVPMECVEVDEDVLLSDLEVEPDFEVVDLGSDKLVIL